MYRVAVLGGKDSILGFKSLGLSVFQAGDGAEASVIADKLAAENYAIIYITENLISEMSDTLDRYKDRRFPAIVPIPGNQGPLGIGMFNIKKSVERAIGADILFKD